MHAWTLQHVSLWLENASANDAIFAHALEWAFRLSLPLRVVAITQPPVTDRIKAWGQAALLRGVTLETYLTAEKTPSAKEQFLRHNGLCVFANGGEWPTEQDLLQRSWHQSSICQLLCGSTFTPINRVLVLCRDPDLRPPFLESAARLCQGLETNPILLILAQSEQEAKRTQECVESVFQSRGMLADLDVVIDGDPGPAVGRVAAWRRCAHILAPRSSATSFIDLRTLSASVSVLTLPEIASLELPRKIRSSRGIFRSIQMEVSAPTPTTEPV